MLSSSMMNRNVLHTSPRFRPLRMQGDVHVLEFSSITSMYGSVHCASQVVRRVPQRFVTGLIGE